MTLFHEIFKIFEVINQKLCGVWGQKLVWVVSTIGTTNISSFVKIREVTVWSISYTYHGTCILCNICALALGPALVHIYHIKYSSPRYNYYLYILTFVNFWVCVPVNYVAKCCKTYHSKKLSTVTLVESLIPYKNCMQINVGRKWRPPWWYEITIAQALLQLLKHSVSAKLSASWSNKYFQLLHEWIVNVQAFIYTYKEHNRKCSIYFITLCMHSISS